MLVSEHKMSWTEKLLIILTLAFAKPLVDIAHVDTMKHNVSVVKTHKYLSF